MHTFVIIIGPGMHMRFGASEGSRWQRKLKKFFALFCWNHMQIKNYTKKTFVYVPKGLGNKLS